MGIQTPRHELWRFFVKDQLNPNICIFNFDEKARYFRGFCICIFDKRKDIFKFTPEKCHCYSCGEKNCKMCPPTHLSKDPKGKDKGHYDARKCKVKPRMFEPTLLARPAHLTSTMNA